LVVNGGGLPIHWVEIPASPLLAFSGDATIEARVKTDSTLINGPDIIFANCIEPDNWGICLGINNKHPFAGVVIGGSVYLATAPSLINTNVAVHLACIRANDTLFMLVNGLVEAKTVIPVGPLRNSPTSVSRIARAQNWNGGEVFSGCVDEVRVWNIARTQPEIFAKKDTILSGAEFGLVAYYQLNETGAGPNIPVHNSAVATGTALDGFTGNNDPFTPQMPYFSCYCPTELVYSQLFLIPTNSVVNVKTYAADLGYKYYYTDITKVIAAIKTVDACEKDFSVDVYIEPNAGYAGRDRYMRRHFVIRNLNTVAGTNRVRLYYSADDFANLQAVVPWLQNHSQLSVTRYRGPGEDNIYNTTGGSTTFIPSSQIVTGVFFQFFYLEFDASDFGEFWIHPSSSTLPLNFINLTARREGDEINLNWYTENEVNVSHFEIEKSINGRDFSVLGVKTANNQPSNNYSFIDNVRNNSSEILFYRIRSIDINGTNKYSSIVKVNISSSIYVSISPNPARGYVNISAFDIEGIRLLGLGGNVVKIWKRPMSNNQKCYIGDISDGLYVLEVSTKRGIVKEKLIIQK
jgi:hypothetical protein